MVLATYNGERYIAEQLRSILDQTRAPDEIVIFDDGSVDATVRIAAALLKDFEGTHVIERSTHNAGLVAAFERALMASTGDVVFLADQDDVWHPEKVDAVLREFGRCKRCALVIHDVDYCDEALQVLGQSKLERFRALGHDADSYVTGMATAVSRDLLDTALPFPDELPGNHDDWLHWVADFFGARCILPRSLALYRRHATNATAKSPINRAQIVPRRGWIGRAFARISKAVGGCPCHRALVAANRAQVGAMARWASSQARDEPGVSRRFRPDDDSVRELELLEDRLRERLRILDQPFWSRVGSAARAYVRGNYTESSGIWSMAKDVVCPCVPLQKTTRYDDCVGATSPGKARRSSPSRDKGSGGDASTL